MAEVKKIEPELDVDYTSNNVTYVVLGYTLPYRGYGYFAFHTKLGKSITSFVDDLRDRGRTSLPSLPQDGNALRADASDLHVLMAYDLGMSCLSSETLVIRPFLVCKSTNQGRLSSETLYLPCRNDSELCTATVEAVAKTSPGVPLTFTALSWMG